MRDSASWSSILPPTNLENFSKGYLAPPIKFIETDEDLLQIVEFGLQGFRWLTREQRIEYVRRLTEINSKIFAFIIPVRSAQPVGYTSIVPLKPDAFMQHADGELGQFYFTDEHVEPPIPIPCHRFLYLQGFVMDRAALRSNHSLSEIAPDSLEDQKVLHKVLYHHVAQHISHFNRDTKYNRPMISAEARDRKDGIGMRSLDAWGFDRIGGHTASGGSTRIFMLDCQHPMKIRKTARVLFDELSRMVQLYASRAQ